MVKTYFMPHGGGYSSGTVLEDVANVLTAKHAGDNAMVEMKACNGNGNGDVSPTLSSDHNNRVTDLTQIVYPLNSMVIGKDVKVRDRQTTGIGEANDPLPTIGACHHHAVAIAENVIGRKPENGGNGVGAKEDVAYTQEATSKPQAVCVFGEQNNDEQKRRAIETLQILRNEIGEKAFSEWAFGRLGCIQEKVVLQSDLYGKGIRAQTNKGKTKMDDGSLPREKNDTEKYLLYLWQSFKSGHTSQGFELAKQFIEQLDMCLSKLSSKNSLSNPYGLVRRLTPLETERLMGFPDNWTLVPFRGKMASDTPRYKACGNSMMVNVMRWIGLGIEAVEQKNRQNNKATE